MLEVEKVDEVQRGRLCKKAVAVFGDGFFFCRKPVFGGNEGPLYSFLAWALWAFSGRLRVDPFALPVV